MVAGDGRVACRNWICAVVLVTVEGRVKKRCTLQIKMCVCVSVIQSNWGSLIKGESEINKIR